MTKPELKQHIIEKILPQYKNAHEHFERKGYNDCLEDIHAKLDEVIEYIQKRSGYVPCHTEKDISIIFASKRKEIENLIYADLREKVQEMASHGVDMGAYVVETKKTYIEKQRILDLLTNKE